MKKILLIMLPTLLLASCAKVNFVNALDETKVNCEFTFNEYEDVKIHTEKQDAYLNDDLHNIASYAKGSEELSRPLTFTLSWTFTSSLEEDVKSYYLNVTTDETFTSFESYECLTNEYTFTNLMIATTYYYFVTANFSSSSFSSDIHTFTTEDKGPRNVYISGVTNARDLGGYKTSQNRRVKQGLVYRMGQLNHSYQLDATPRINEAGRKMLVDTFKVKSEIDLREIKNNESGSLYQSILGKDINYYPCPMTWDVTNAAKNETEMIRKVFKVFTNQNNYPVIFHCAIGTDRTGVIAFYLNALLGLEIDDIYHDYLFSNFGDIGGSRNIDNAVSHFNYLSSFSGATLQEKAYSYFESIGFTKAELDTICDIMLTD